MESQSSQPSSPAGSPPTRVFLSDALIRNLAQAADWPEFQDQRYEVLEPLGQGGMGTVYRARDRELDREVAVKVLRLPREVSGDAARILREARLTGRMEHPGIVPVHDVGTLADGRVFYVMKLIRGRRLDEYVRDTGSLRDRLRVFERVCDTVAFAHAHGVVHRDLKPQNIMVGAFGEVLVMDWGVAKLLKSPGHDGTEIHASNPTFSADGAIPEVGEDVTSKNRSLTVAALKDEADTLTRPTQAGTVVGTPRYMSPEQARGDVAGTDRRADVYALGGILRFLYRERDGNDVHGSSRHVTPVRTADSHLTTSRRSVRILNAIQSKAMNPEPDNRYADAAALSGDIRAFLDGQSVSAYPETRLEAAARVIWKYRAFILLMIAYLITRVLMFKLTGI